MLYRISFIALLALGLSACSNGENKKKELSGSCKIAYESYLKGVGALSAEDIKQIESLGGMTLDEAKRLMYERYSQLSESECKEEL
ncbi:hypothetical protein VQ643_08695 [Pseudomonas sp. F1_0610]|uniref:hypothetical protein n=1 Tax=Pseudomonas sp. F1_0610 TaxID=3114284 RepID=UPI0039C2DB00